MRFKGKPGGAVLALFLWNHIVQTCISNNSTLQPKLKTWRSSWGKSWKLVWSLKLHWGSSFQTCARFGPDHSEWSTSLLCYEEREHTRSLTTQRCCRFVIVGMEFLQALHRKFLALRSSGSFQIFFQKGFSISAWIWLKGSVVRALVLRKKYPNLAVYSLDWTNG